MQTKMKFTFLIITYCFQILVYGQIDEEFSPITSLKVNKETVYVKYKMFERKKLFFNKYYNTQGKVMRFEQFLQRTDTPENVTTFSFNSTGLVTIKLNYFYYNNKYVLMDSFCYLYQDTQLLTIRHYEKSNLKGKLVNSFQDSFLNVSEYWYYFNDTTQVQMNFLKTFNKAGKPLRFIRSEGDTTYYFYDHLGRDSFQYQTYKADTHEIRFFVYQPNKTIEEAIGKTFPDWTYSIIITTNQLGKKTEEICQFKHSKTGYRNVYKYNKENLLIKQTNKNWSTKQKEHNFKWTYYHSYE